MTTHHDESKGQQAPMSDEQFLKEHQSELSRSVQHARWIHQAPAVSDTRGPVPPNWRGRASGCGGVCDGEHARAPSPESLCGCYWSPARDWNG